MLKLLGILPVEALGESEEYEKIRQMTLKILLSAYYSSAKQRSIRQTGETYLHTSGDEMSQQLKIVE